MPDAHDLAKTYFGAARSEILQRLSMRETVLLAGVTAFGVIGGMALSSHMAALFYLFPLLSFAFTLVLFRHHFLITALGRYINAELGPTLEIDPSGMQPAGGMPLHWDAWLFRVKGAYIDAPFHSLRLILAIEWFSSLLLLLGPGLAAFLWFYGTLPRLVFWVDLAALTGALAPYCIDGWRIVFLRRAARKLLPAHRRPHSPSHRPPP